MHALKNSILLIINIVIIMMFESCTLLPFGTYTNYNNPTLCISQNTLRLIIRKRKYFYEKSPAFFLGGGLVRKNIKMEFFEMRYDIKNIHSSLEKPYSIRKLLVLGKRPAYPIKYNYPGYVYPVGASELALYEDPISGVYKCKDNCIFMKYNIVDKHGKIRNEIIGDKGVDFIAFSPDHLKAYFVKYEKVRRYNILENSEEAVLSDRAYSLVKNNPHIKATRHDNIFMEKKDFASNGGTCHLLDINNGAILKTFSVPDEEQLIDICLMKDSIYLLLWTYPAYVIRDVDGGLITKFIYGPIKYSRRRWAWDPDNERFCIVSLPERSFSGRDVSKLTCHVILWHYRENKKQEFSLDVPLESM